MSNVNWPRIKELLDNALERWKLENGRDPKMKASHEGDIGWETKEELAASAPYGKRLIDTDKVGNGRAYGNQSAADSQRPHWRLSQNAVRRSVFLK